jgi:8-oxo-dGTP pyrophosphatase MutT (NUDIX family)
MSDPRRDTLHTWLQALAPALAEERAHRSRMLTFAAQPGAFGRDHFTPGHFTASAFVLAPDDSALLLIHHARLDRWLQPGGHVEPGDADLLATARRELSEEVGVDDAELAAPGIFDVDVHGIPAARGEPGHEHFDVRFLFRARSRALRISSEAHAAAWVPFAELAPRQTDHSVLRAARKLATRALLPPVSGR